MKRVLTICFVLFYLANIQAQVITIVGTGVNGWPPTNGPEITLNTTDGITYSIQNLAINTGFVKFRQDYSWNTNWGGNTFPNGQGIQDGPNIATIAGTYNVTFNSSNGTYTFISSGFPSIGIWGPAVDSQNGYGGPDVNMTSTDGITYTLSGFYFSSGNAYFREDDNGTAVWGSTSFPTGTAVTSGPSLFIPGGEWFVTFNRLTGDYSFSYPGVGIIGTSLPNGFSGPDTDLITTDGFSYYLNDLYLTSGEVKFRKDNSWATNWGATSFPIGTGVQDGPNIPIAQSSLYSIIFTRLTGEYQFVQLLSNPENNASTISLYPNPTQTLWNITATLPLEHIEITDALGKIVYVAEPNTTTVIVDAESWQNGIYFGKISCRDAEVSFKLIKN